MLIVKRVQRLRGGGGDGGVYPLTHAEQKWMTPSGMGTTGGGCHSNMTKDRASEGTLRLDRSSVCAATAKPLRAPIAVDELGYLLNKEDVIELMLSKALPPHLSHIKSLKSLRDATMHPNPAYVAAQKEACGALVAAAYELRECYSSAGSDPTVGVLPPASDSVG